MRTLRKIKNCGKTKTKGNEGKKAKKRSVDAKLGQKISNLSKQKRIKKTKKKYGQGLKN